MGQLACSCLLKLRHVHTDACSRSWESGALLANNSPYVFIQCLKLSVLVIILNGCW